MHEGNDSGVIIEGLLAVIGVCISIYVLGYENGQKDAKK